MFSSLSSELNSFLTLLLFIILNLTLVSPSVFILMATALDTAFQTRAMHLHIASLMHLIIMPLMTLPPHLTLVLTTLAAPTRTLESYLRIRIITHHAPPTYPQYQTQTYHNRSHLCQIQLPDGEDSANII